MSKFIFILSCLLLTACKPGGGGSSNSRDTRNQDYQYFEIAHFPACTPIPGGFYAQSENQNLVLVYSSEADCVTGDDLLAALSQVDYIAFTEVKSYDLSADKTIFLDLDRASATNGVWVYITTR